MRLAAEEFRTQRLRMLHQTSRSRAAAEEDHCRKQEKELQVLVLAAQKGLNWSSLEPQLALALARTARDTLMAEEKTAKLRVEECKSLLATLQDSMDDAQARAQDAHHQIASIMTLFDQQGIHIDYRPLHFNSAPIQDHPISLDLESDNLECDLESTSHSELAPDEDF